MFAEPCNKSLINLVEGTPTTPWVSLRRQKIISDRRGPVDRGIGKGPC